MDGQLLSYDVRLPITSRLHHPKSYWVASRPKMSSNIRQSISLVALTAIFVKWLHGLVDDSFVTATWIFPDGFPTASRWEDLLRLRYFLLYVNSAVFKKRRKLFRNLSIKKRLLNLGSVFPGRVLKKKAYPIIFFLYVDVQAPPDPLPHPLPLPPPLPLPLFFFLFLNLRSRLRVK